MPMSPSFLKRQVVEKRKRAPSVGGFKGILNQNGFTMKRLTRGFSSGFSGFLAAWMAFGLPVFGQAPTLKPLPEGRWQTEFPGGVAADVKVPGRYAFVAADVGGLEVIDVSDQTIPVRAGGCRFGEAWDLVLSGHYAFLRIPKNRRWRDGRRCFLGDGDGDVCLRAPVAGRVTGH